MDVRVASLTNLGMGVCRVTVPTKVMDGADESTVASNDNTDSETTNNATSEWVIFVPNVIPDELVRIRIFRNHKNYSDADLIQVLEASPDRKDVDCPLSQQCGGCQYQHMVIEAQRDWKTLQVSELLERIAGLPDTVVSATVGTDEVLGYRSKITPHYDQKWY